MDKSIRTQRKLHIQHDVYGGGSWGAGEGMVLLLWGGASTLLCAGRHAFTLSGTGDHTRRAGARTVTQGL